jgi:hypothetical protein
MKQRVILKTGDWTLVDTSTGWTLLDSLGWKAVMQHDCSAVEGAPYWMLLETYRAPHKCMYCDDPIPEQVLVPFVLLNEHKIKR